MTRRMTIGLVVGLALRVAPLRAADDLASPAPSAAVPPAPAATAASAATTPRRASGLAVVALAGATDAAWTLAQSLYAEPLLRAPQLDEVRARVLCGASPPPDSTELRDLADTVAAVRGDDAPSRALLADIARTVSARALVVVRVERDERVDGRPRATARVFLSGPAEFDAATYPSDAAPTQASPSPLAWSATTRSLVRAFGTTPAPSAGDPTLHAPPLALHEASKKESSGVPRPFYESVWFWGAVGAAVVAGGATYFATRDSSPSTIHLEVQVPR